MQQVFVHVPQRRLEFRRLLVAALIGAGSGFAACSEAPTSPENPGGLRGATAVQLPGITATACQYGGEYPDCKPKPIDGGGTTTPVAPAAGGAGGGVTQPPPDSTADRPCSTRDSVLNSPAVQAGFKDLWARSNSGGTMSQRYERGGWVIRDSQGGYSIQSFPDSWTTGPCGIDAPLGTVPPPGSVAWVHTHPYAAGDTLTSCPALRLTLPNGSVYVQYSTYANNPSDYDGLASTGWNLSAYIIDKNKITAYVGDGTSSTQYRVTNRVSRCGY